MSTNLSTPWTPILAGQECARYEPYDSIVDEGAVPNVFQDPDWVLKRLEPELEKTPNGRDALWEGILALWRLKLCEKAGSNDPNWRNLMSAWLHRHKELCQYLNVAPYKTVVHYADALGATEFLAETIPRDQSELDQSELDRRLGSEPAKGADVDDVEMVEVAGPSVAVPTRKGKERAQSNFPASGSESQQLEPGLEQAGSKRGPQESPTQDRRTSKRVRDSSKPETPAVNLANFSFEEDSLIDISLVPALKDEMCHECQTQSKKQERQSQSKKQKRQPQPGKQEPFCKPIWHKNGKITTLRCWNCLKRKKGCSFKDYHWGITDWPTLTVTKSAAQRRAKETEAKRKGPTLGGKEAGPSDVNKKRKKVAGPSVQEEGSTERKKYVFEHVLITRRPPTIKPAIKPLPAPTPAPAPAPVATPAPGGTTHHILLKDILQYEKLLSDPDSSPFALKMKALELRSIGCDEEGSSKTLIQHIRGRSELICKLAQALSDAGSDDEVDNMEGDNGVDGDDEDQGDVEDHDQNQEDEGDWCEEE